ncbi:MAG: YjbH domain-containing protein [Candidatus Cloacimonetes bacterium]|nr:YjbH domain-containing protein [Candidatus Cloacimonadota bacterium]
MKKVILSVIVIAAMFGLLEAAPFQTLGMLRTPDAYVLPHKAAEFLLVGYYRDVAKPTPNDGLSPYFMAGVGLMDRVELGLFVGDKVDDDMVYFLNLKVKVLQETLKLPQVAVGLDNIFSPVGETSVQDLNQGDDFFNHPDKADYEMFSPYLVASKQAVVLGMPWMFNMGLGAHRFTGQVARSRVWNGLFYSAEMSPFNNFFVQGEYSGHDFNAGIKYAYKNWGFKIGAQAIEDLVKDNGYEDNLRIGFGVSYLMDRFAEAKRDNGRPNLWQYADAGFGDDYLVDTTLPPGQTGVVVPPTGSTTVTPGGTEVVTGPSGTVLQTPGMSAGGSASYSQLSPEVRDLLEELRLLREERQKAQRSLDELRTWIQQMKTDKP